MKICTECEREFDDTFRNVNSRYCSDNCKAKIRRRVQKVNRERRKEKMKSNDIDYIANHIHTNYKQRAPSRGLEFTLTVEYFKQHFRADCHYCGDPMDNVGFDRVENHIGYIESNVVPCCTQCNLMKRTLSKEYFLDKCRKIASNLSL